MFELNISCSKEFDELHIVFSDGSGMVTTKPSSNKDRKETKEQTFVQKNISKKRTNTAIKKEETLDIDADFSSVSQDIIEKPVIGSMNRDVKVADELQNLDL